jgi:hypothetical protein
MRSTGRLGTDEPLDLFLFAGAAGRREGYRPYFENYTVDASIFEMISVNHSRRLAGGVRHGVISHR